MASIELKNIAHQYPSEDKSGPYALSSLNELWQDGGAYALLGPSGCGKTTLLNIISGLLQPSEGRVLFDGVDVTDLSPEKRNIAQVFQFPVVYDTLTVAENLAFPLKNRGMAKDKITERVAEILSMLGLSDRANEKAHSLTADDKQKISLGRGLVRTDVKAILFDEPLTVIDPHLKWQLRTELKKIHQQFRHTMIYVTHDQTEALTFADKVIVMYGGSVLQIGTPEELFETPAHTFVGQFIGSPGMNILKASVDGTVAIVDGIQLELPGNYRKIDDQVELGIRPEYISLSQTGGIQAETVSIDDVGKHIIVRCRLERQIVSVIVPEGTSIPDKPRLVFAQDKINIYQNAVLVRPAD
jgi:glycerol transport system ATP-binding protein|tara:strand:- start:2789 stop:3856 length:1068 start_codon:yes stop_codon:yes gene_type:complete